MNAVIKASAQRVAEFNPHRFIDLRGIVPRRGVAELLDSLRHSPIVELRGGVGWGKTSVALAYAAAQQRRNATRVVLFEREAGVRVCAGLGDGAGECESGEVLYVIDDCAVSSERTDAIIEHLQRNDRAQVLVCSRTPHAFTEAARQQQMVARSVRLPEMKMTAHELVDIALTRNLRLDHQRAEYIIHAGGGWPLVVVRCVDLLADGTRAASVAALDQLVSQCFESVIAELFGGDALAVLARAAMSDRVCLETVHAAESPVKLRALFERIHELGLGEWVSSEH